MHAIPNPLAATIRQDYDSPDDPDFVASRLAASGADSMRQECPDVRAGDWFVSDGVTGAIYRQWMDGTWTCIWSSW